MRTRRTFNPTSNRVARFNRMAKIDTVLKAYEIDVFAGMAADLFDSLASFVEDQSATIKDVSDQIFYAERDLKDAKNKLKSCQDKLKVFAPFSKLISPEDEESLTVISLGNSLQDNAKEMQEEVSNLELDLSDLKEELSVLEGDALFVALVEDGLLEDLDQDDTVEGLSSFATALAELISVADDEFIFDTLGGDAREMILMMEKIGL